MPDKALILCQGVDVFLGVRTALVHEAEFIRPISRGPKFKEAECDHGKRIQHGEA